MRTIATLAATAFLLAGCVRPQVAPQTPGDHSVEESLRDLHKKLDELAATLAATRAQLERCHPTGGGIGEAPPPIGEAPPPIGEVPPPIGEAPPPRGDPKSMYNAAYNDYLKGNYDLAQRGFQEYVSNFPGSELTDNAHYWMGETYYRQRRFRQAIDQFEVVLKQYPQGDKAAAALLKKAYCHLELGERAQGIAQLRQVIRRHPASDEARLARQRLRDLGIDAD